MAMRSACVFFVTPSNSSSQTVGCACNEPAWKSSGLAQNPRSRKLARAGFFATMDWRTKGPTKGAVPSTMPHQDGSVVPQALTASLSFHRNANGVTYKNKAESGGDKKQRKGKLKGTKPFVVPQAPNQV